MVKKMRKSAKRNYYQSYKAKMIALRVVAAYAAAVEFKKDSKAWLGMAARYEKQANKVY